MHKHLTELLYEAFAKDMQETGTQVSEADQTTIKAFLEWVHDYLSNKNRPAAIFYPGLGLGLRMSRGEAVVLQSQEYLEDGALLNTPAYQAGLPPFDLQNRPWPVEVQQIFGGK
jgi:hypothetical protein